MYCRNCGNQMVDTAVVCVKCGTATGNGQNFCATCGQPAAPGAAICATCGSSLAQPIPDYMRKSKLVAGLLGIFVGGLGVHNFYLGFNGKAIAQIFLSFCFGIGAIWGFVEGILILTGNIDKDADGIPLKD